MAQPDLLDLPHVLRELATNFLRATRTDSMSDTAASTLSLLSRRGAMRITVLAEHEGVTQPAMTGLVQRLEAGGLVSRATDARDGRAALIDITPLGRRTLAQQRADEDAIVLGRLAELSADERAALEAAMPALYVLGSARGAAALR